MNRSDRTDKALHSFIDAHTTVNEQHEHSRARLLSQLPASPPQPATPRWKRTRYVVGGLGAVASTIALAIWLIGPTTPAVAMEQLAKALDNVTSYSYRMESVYVSREDQGRTVKQVTDGRWQTMPMGIHATIRIQETLGTNTKSPAPTTTLVHLEESHLANKRGILVDHLKKEYWWIDQEIDADAIPPGSPQVAVYMVRQRRGRVLRDLGNKLIDGRKARGLELQLDDDQPVSELGRTSPEPGESAEWDWRNEKVEVWIDPSTNLPIEFRTKRLGDHFETKFRFTDLNWNVDFPASSFEPVAPAGYSERQNVSQREDETK